ncbi:MAG: dTMP kinase [Alphaproteobacteria bacterium]|jgi:dTMP kinase
MQKGALITFEGSEAVGKSTIIQKIADYLNLQNIDHIVTREPGGTVLAENIRQLIFHGSTKPSDMTELLLLFAARRDHIERIIAPALQDNKIVLCDRYIDSSYVYQSVMQAIPENIIDMLVTEFVTPILPHICFVIDCEGAVSYKRIKKRGIENHNDANSVEYFERLRQGFLERSSINKHYPYMVVQNDNLDHAIHKITDYISRNILSE